MNILCISSQVVYGPVGNSAAVPALEAAGFTVLAIPTTVLSNHPGHTAPAGIDLPAKTMGEMLQKLEDHNWLDHCGAVMTGYFRDEKQVGVAADSITELKRREPKLTYLCDPVIGDDHTGLYVPVPVAEAIRDQLLPMADIISPNRFELEWLTGRAVSDIASARAATRTLQCPTVLVSSLLAGSARLATAAIGPEATATVTTRQRNAVPHGTGDLLSGLFLAEILLGYDPATALGKSVAILEHVLEASGDAGTLALPTGLAEAHSIAALPVEVTGD